MNCGLLGAKLGHSYSPQIHSFLGAYRYCLFEREPDDLESFFREGAFAGINVTIPYKKAVIPYCAELSNTAMKLGAVNTVVKRSDGTYVGHNTDYFGFSSMLRRSGLAPKGKKALVLGSGGASVTAVSVLKEAGAEVVVVSRSGENNYTNLHRHADAAILVNATPVGMFPNNGITPVDLDIFPKLEGVLDLIYNPAKTKLLLDAEKRGIICENGLWMLVAQAKESAEWFTGQNIGDAVISRIYDHLSRQMQNIILVGMPGSGKSTIGMLLAQKLGRQFFDSDAEIEKLAQMSIPQIFARHGEEGFRALETQVLADLGKGSGAVIATGGGCVTRDENYPLLHQNGKIIWLQRELSALPTNGRPLSANGKLEEMYSVREPLYRAFADYTVSNNSSVSEAIEKIFALEVIL